jgi:hypothetical protein
MFAPMIRIGAFFVAYARSTSMMPTPSPTSTLPEIAAGSIVSSARG